jgi:amidohydrolase
LGQENVIELQKPSLGAEDFAEFLNEIPGAMFRLGVAGSNGCAPLHSSKFDPDERAIAVGIKVITESIVRLNDEIIKKVDK